MNKRKTILVFVDWFVPGTNAGGPIRSVFSLVKLLQNEFDFKIFTRNTDHNSTVPYAGIVPDQWTKFDEGIEVYYCSEQNLDQNRIKQLLENIICDKIYINSLYSKWFSIVPLQLLKKRKEMHKVVLAPRGMLGKGALQIKALKKKVFLRYARIMGLHKGITWQASSDSEKKDIVRIMGDKAMIKIAGNLSYIEQLPFREKEKQEGVLSLFFLSRVVPIKNLHTALLSLKNVSNFQVTYAIYGPVEDQAYYQQCLEIVKTLPTNIKVEFKGVIGNEKIQETLQAHHALLMPTLNENFGHAILESFCAACPVIISDQTPWQALEKNGVGYNVRVFESGAQAELTTVVSYLAAMDQVSFNTMAQNAYHYGRQYQSDNAQREASAGLFR